MSEVPLYPHPAPGVKPEAFDERGVLFAESAAHREKSRAWNVSKQRWNLC